MILRRQGLRFLPGAFLFLVNIRNNFDKFLNPLVIEIKALKHDIFEVFSKKSCKKN